jgi:hypothetical protein
VGKEISGVMVSPDNVQNKLCGTKSSKSSAAEDMEMRMLVNNKRVSDDEIRQQRNIVKFFNFFHDLFVQNCSYRDIQYFIL